MSLASFDGTLVGAEVAGDHAGIGSNLGGPSFGDDVAGLEALIATWSAAPKRAEARVTAAERPLIAQNRILYEKTCTKYDSAMRILDVDIEVEPDRYEQSRRRRDQHLADLWKATT